jgi:hypothetical protein
MTEKAFPARNKNKEKKKLSLIHRKRVRQEDIFPPPS